MITRRRFMKSVTALTLGLTARGIVQASHPEEGAGNKGWAYVVDTYKCIGCGNCVKACKKENHVPEDHHVYRTWVESYRVKPDGQVTIESPNGGFDGFNDVEYGKDEKAFFVPKLCNQCKEPPCVQVCPVGATYKTKDGVVLVNRKWCIGCSYCIQACPYKARFIHPEVHVADKCTWCYHRISKGMKPACVQACPTGARSFGDLSDETSTVREVLKTKRVGVLHPELGTKPAVYYVGLDKEVR